MSTFHKKKSLNSVTCNSIANDWHLLYFARLGTAFSRGAAPVVDVARSYTKIEPLQSPAASRNRYKMQINADNLKVVVKN